MVLSDMPVNVDDNSEGRMTRINTAGNRGEGQNLCNCRIRGNCPLDNKCLLDNIVYEAMVRTERSSFRYIGSTANSFKKRLANHLHSFNEVESLNMYNSIIAATH